MFLHLLIVNFINAVKPSPDCDKCLEGHTTSNIASCGSPLNGYNSLEVARLREYPKLLFHCESYIVCWLGLGLVIGYWRYMSWRMWFTKALLTVINVILMYLDNELYVIHIVYTCDTNINHGLSIIYDTSHSCIIIYEIRYWKYIFI